MIYYYFKTAKDESYTVLDAPREGCWIHVEEATVDDLLEIARLTGIEQSNLLDCLDKYEIPRIEKIKHHVMLFIRYPSDAELGLYTSPLTIILTNHTFITISPLFCPFIKSFLLRKGKYSTLQKSKMLLNIFLKIAQEFTTQIKRVRQEVLKQEKEMIYVDSEDITELTRSEEVLNQYMSSLTPFHYVLEEMTSGRYTSLYEKDQEHLEDLQNAVKQSETLCEIVLKSIRSLRDSYQIIFTNNLHKTIKLLTSLTIIFSIPTMVASIYGMNIDLPLAHSSIAFFFILCFIAALSLLGLYFFRYKKWL